MDVGGPFGGPDGGPFGGPDGGPVGGPDGGPAGGPDGGPEGGPVGGPEGGPVGGPGGVLLAGSVGKLGGVGAEGVDVFGNGGGVGALTVSSISGLFLCNRMSCCESFWGKSSVLRIGLDSSLAVVCELGDDSGILSKSDVF